MHLHHFIDTMDTKVYQGNYMYLPKTQEYALRCMAQIALLPWEATINSEMLHELTHAPRGYISKVLNKIVSAGLLKAGRGHGGGFRLARPPSQITYLEILESTGYSFDPDRCVSGWGTCNVSSPCPLHNSFSKLNKILYNWASQTTLADVQQTREMLSRMNGGPKVVRKKKNNA